MASNLGGRLSRPSRSSCPSWSSCSKTKDRQPTTLRRLFDLAVFQLDRGGAAEDGDGDPQAGAFLVDLFHRAVEAGERAVGDADGLADLELDGRLRTLDALFDGPDDPGDFLLGHRHRLGAGTQE